MAALRRGLIWTLLVVALVVVVTATAVDRLRRPEPPPVFAPVPAFSLTNRDGRTVRLQDLEGKPWIADFIFTRCPASCPLMTARMAKLDRELPDDLDVRLVSFSVDPEHDTPQALQHYAQSYKAPARWLFLTGGKDQMYRLSRQGFKLGIDIPPPPAPGAPAPEPILHSTRFVLVDGHGRIRGYYDGFDEESMKKLVRDLEAVAG
ncbi:MAG TPA: SCO family protein [Thermoanaerobaculia bacterium]